MGSYVSSTKKQQQEMLSQAGFQDFDDLFAQVPKAVKLSGPLNLPPGKAELEVKRQVQGMAAKNQVFSSVFRGAGAYRHYIPAIVKSITAKETFLTAYTPYQAEVSQGILQSIFEYQTMICELTGLDAANASIYDGASAAAEAAAMCRDRKRTKTYISQTANPQVIETMMTYCRMAGYPVELIPEKDGETDLAALRELLDDETAGVYLQQPNYYGQIEACEEAAQIIHEKGAKFIMGINPIAAVLLKSPGECGADIAVGEGQSLGMPLSYGGPYLGFMAAAKEMMRKLPGRIVGETTDSRGQRAYVLTLQAREQHIRREKASSNVCSNQALCAMTAAVYLAAMGPGGLREAAVQSMSKARYLAAGLEQAGLKRVYQGEFFHEFLTTCQSPDLVLNALAAKGILGGLPTEKGILWCATELNTKEEMDLVIQTVREVLGV